MATQQEFLRETATTLGLTQKGLAERMNAPWPTFEKWLLPPTAGSSREMPAIAWQLAREIIDHEKLKTKYKKLKNASMK